MQGENIICFAKDWSEDPTSNNHVLEELARDNRVLWLNSISTRVPNLRSGRDLKKIFAKLSGALRGPACVRKGLWVYTPLVLPLPHSRWAKAINLRILQLSVGILRRTLGMKDFQLWTFLPNVAEYAGRLGESLLVYYCVDEWSRFSYVNGPLIEDAETQLCKRADIVFATAQSLVDRRRGWNPETHLARHGVDHALFSRALDPSTPVPTDIESLPRPIIGFYGTLQDWVDQDLIAHVAGRRPDWSIVLIGNPMVDLSRVTRFANVHVLGRRPHAMLPHYCKAFDVGIIPYVLGERVRHVNPIKLREYLSAGLPVVSVAIPEVEAYAPHCTVAVTYHDFIAAIESALRTDTAQLRLERTRLMSAETWRHRVAELSKKILNVKDRKCHRKEPFVPDSSAPAISATTT
jgi:glycosyltransferase involved in cell wall biosynthesis